jgi:hypothetical protein
VAVGAQHVGEHGGAEAVVLAAGRAVAAAQVLDLPGVTTTTSKPAAGSASTTGPSGRSMATRSTPWSMQSVTSRRIPAASWRLLRRATTAPSAATMHSSLVSVAH